MTEEVRADTRTRLLDAAAEMIASAPGEEVSLRAVCAAAGVQMPTLYHFFGNKQGLTDAVVERGFDLYLAEKSAGESTGDPIQDIRDGWDAHVAFGLRNPGFYTLMYGKVRPGYSPSAQARPSELLRELTKKAHEQGRLCTTPEQAAAHVLVTNIGVTLRQIVLATEDRDLSIAVREGVIAAITGSASSSPSLQADVRRVLEHAVTQRDLLGGEETALLTKWLSRLLAAGSDG
ncbi:TetR/AcrR family transcriptional regulator [Aeromicrobium sp. SORGH_AS_0981]|uniref:TetR/AcrR family transcriptional regulator n=1 Tax=Aeromicrobium sp. SORGH_AS_0981 TaxID=3041802 RepID=UPI00286B454A|nr:TetR/AcrR family transcriptional regulator [Aeromicrobium sp. SORGH_AS_0981]